MIRSGTSKDANRRKGRALQPGVLILAEIAFATLLLYLANQPLHMADFDIATAAIDSDIASPTITSREIANPEIANREIANREIARMEPTQQLATVQNSEAATDFTTAASVASISANINATITPIRN